MEERSNISLIAPKLSQATPAKMTDINCKSHRKFPLNIQTFKIILETVVLNITRYKP